MRDTGSTTNGGIIDDVAENTLTFDVSNISDEPSGTDKTISITENSIATLKTTDFGFTDAGDNDSFTGITITQIPSQGTLQLSGNPISVTQTISEAAISNGDLVFVPAANQTGTPYDSFDFKVNDSGNTSNGGVNQDQLANRITINVNDVSEAPAGKDNILITSEDTPIASRLPTSDFQIQMMVTFSLL